MTLLRSNKVTEIILQMLVLQLWGLDQLQLDHTFFHQVDEQIM